VRGDLHLHPGDAGVRLHLTFITSITSSAHYTVSVGVPTFLVRGDVYFWGSLMGACLIASLPIAILYNLFVDRFVAGFTMGAIK
jgi:multiple sugar transport system permease protein